MDPIITKLNQVAQEKIKQVSTPSSTGQSGKPDFNSQFDQTLADKLLEKMQESYGSDAQPELTALSADDIQIEVAGKESGEASFSSGEKYFDMFKDMNKDLVSLDAAIETLTTPGLKITPRQMLALQAGIANTTIMAEGFSRFTDAVARGIQTIVQTQVG